MVAMRAGGGGRVSHVFGVAFALARATGGGPIAVHSYTADAGWGSGGAVISWPWRRRGGVSPQEAVGKKIEAMEIGRAHV